MKTPISHLINPDFKEAPQALMRASLILRDVK
jgi:hypothetical protein